MKKHLIVLLLFLSLSLVMFFNGVSAVEWHEDAFGGNVTINEPVSSPSTPSSNNDTFIVVYQPSSNIMGVVGLMGLVAIPFIAYIWNKKKEE